MHYLYEPGSFVPVAQALRKRPIVLHRQPDWRQREYDFDQDPLWQTTMPPQAFDTIAWYHCDHLGTPMELTDPHGNVAWAGQYKAWGEVREERSEWAKQHGLSNPIRFQGQYHDHETGLHYNRYRYYDSKGSRFTSQDPIGLSGGLNLYVYVPSSTQWIDPLGLSGCVCKLTETSTSVINQQRLNRYYTQYEKYGSAGAKELENGRYRFYGELKSPRTPGEMKGARLVREWDPNTDERRTWYETVDHYNNIRSVAPKPITHEKNHHIFEASGKYIGRR